MQSGMAHAPTPRGTPPGAADIDPRRNLRAILAAAAGGRLPRRHADAPAVAFLQEARPCTSGSDTLLRRGPDVTGQPQR
jgi:hypothetical protein